MERSLGVGEGFEGLEMAGLERLVLEAVAELGPCLNYGSCG